MTRRADCRAIASLRSVQADPESQAPNPESRTMLTVIAIDGPSGVGKGTVARAVAAALGYRHVDTGAMYRAVAWRAAQLGVDLDDEEAVVRRGAVRRDRGGREPGRRLTARTSRPRFARRRSTARRPGWRACRGCGPNWWPASGRWPSSGPLVMEGRDIGTVVFPARGGEDLPRCLARGARAAPGPRPGAHRRADAGPGRASPRPCSAGTRTTARARPRRCASRPTPPWSTRRPIPAAQVVAQVLAIVRARVS